MHLTRTIFGQSRIMIRSQEDILERVRNFAGEAHGNQTRKYSDEPFIGHPIRVMETCQDYTNDLSMLAAALLHDVLEDTHVNKDTLRNFLTDIMNKEEATRTLRLVEELTDVYIKQNYSSLNRRTRRNKEAERLSETSADAQTIKYADIIDNVVDITRDDADFALIYLRENKHLLKQINKGNPALYERAIQTVDECLQEFWSKANVKAL